MKKAVKSTLIWGTTVAVAAGVAVAIAIPVTNAKNKVTNTNPIKDFNKDAYILGDATNGGVTGQQLLDALANTGITDSSLLTKLKYQLSFHLYEQEQQGSIALQKDYLSWDLYSVNSNIINFFKSSLQFKDEDKIKLDTDLSLKDIKLEDYSKTQELRLKLYNALVVAGDAKINDWLKGITNPNDAQKAEKENLQKSFADFKTKWNNKVNLFNKLTDVKNPTIDWKSSSVTSDFSKVLLPLSEIRAKQQSIYNERKNTFISSYKGKGDGNLEWQKQFSTNFGGATSEAEAIDYLVSQQVSSSAWVRYSFSLNSSFTYEQLKSEIFADILGTEADNKVHFKANAEKTDKVYFIASGTRTPSEMNISGDQAKVTALLSKQANLIKIHNAILGFKQDTTEATKPWTITKEQLIKMFQAFQITSGTSTGAITRAVDQFKNIFGSDEALTRELVGRFSSTTDSTQWSKGDLGWSTQLTAMGSYYPGFSLGVAAALDKDQSFGKTVTTSSSAENFVSQLMTAVKNGMQQVTNDKGQSSVDNTPTSGSVTEYNRNIEAFINKLTDEEISRYIGTKVQDLMMNIKVEDDGTIRAAGSSAVETDKGNHGTVLKGLPAAIKIADGVYMVNADEAGMHVIQVETAVDAVKEMNAELQAVADKQDESEMHTQWAKLITDSFTQISQLHTLLGVSVDQATKVASIDTTSDVYKYLVKNDVFAKFDSYQNTAEGQAKWASDVAKLINSLESSQTLEKVQTNYRDAVLTWLQGKFDSRLWSSEDGFTISPREIYKTITEAATAGGIK